MPCSSNASRASPPEAQWRLRYRHINEFERILSETGTRVVKLFLHISKDEQRRRLQRRLDRPDKHWKFNPDDLEQRALWDGYPEAYADCLHETSTNPAPWHIIPADDKLMRDVAALRILVHVLEEMDPQYPDPIDLPAAID